MIAENHNSVRQAYLSMLSAEDDFLVTGHSENGYELLKLVEKDEPNIVITEIDMPVMNGNKLIKMLQNKFPKIKVIVLSSQENESVSQFIINGACACISKKCDFKEVIIAINKVFTEGYYINKAFTNIIAHAPQYAGSKLKETDLSTREIDVLKLICEEKLNAEIAVLLKVRITTVATHRQNIYRKINSNSAIGLYKYAVKKGIISL